MSNRPHELDNLDEIRRKATGDARAEVGRFICNLGYRVSKTSSGGLRNVLTYESKQGDEVVMFVEYTDYRFIRFTVDAKSTDPSLAKLLAPMVTDASQASADYASLLGQHRIMQELNS
jgi:hypothetical protein